MAKEDIVRELTATGDYRVIERFREQNQYSEEALDSEKKLIGVYLDTETMGLNSTVDKIIELGLVAFEFSPDGRIFKILETFSEFEEPNEPIPAEITAITGITDEMVAGQHIDWNKVREIIAPASVVIAHNAGFDRRFIELVEPEFIKKAWACSMRDIDWSKEGIESSKLEFIAYRLGFFFEGHRALNDCLAGIHALSHPLPLSGVPALKAMLDRARDKDCRVWALRSPFDSKDILKSRGYRWNPGENGNPKSWYVDIAREKLTRETNFLHQEIYGRDEVLRVDEIDAFNRYSDRI